MLKIISNGLEIKHAILFFVFNFEKNQSTPLDFPRATRKHPVQFTNGRGDCPELPNKLFSVYNVEVFTAGFVLLPCFQKLYFNYLNAPFRINRNVKNCDIFNDKLNDIRNWMPRLKWIFSSCIYFYLTRTDDYYFITLCSAVIFSVTNAKYTWLLLFSLCIFYSYN